MGVHSLSNKKTFKQVGFPSILGVPEKQATYSDWRFIYRPLVLDEGSKS